MVSDNEFFRNYELTLPDGNIIRKTENKNVEQMIEDNQRELNDNAGRRWGDGKVFWREPMTTVFQLRHGRSQQAGRSEISAQALE